MHIRKRQCRQSRIQVDENVRPGHPFANLGDSESLEASPDKYLKLRDMIADRIKPQMLDISFAQSLLIDAYYFLG